ncbi:MAG: hydantoinase/oxoprolinase family protein [Thermovirgaceae bacterium]|nr:hydantoinase/oxoprolinase family protein [Synergistales bacterium]MDI9393818.1 hydantoinase/oxoprolinase family protein [Synergistota bacterium]MDY0178374.1 hydantoinase/oxoprolinase family protein [Synergistaceae bacterium]HRW87107.1 hydantoinase/oxoprolinase family protein [Thermovirgaceae bacterium]MDD3133255.1 hydantoinase/oxoprolinase family protein [Synergistales bacterium]
MKDDTIIGIDTGGTFTDAVLLERKLGKILAWAKVRTDPHDLGSCVREVIEDLIRKDGRARNAGSVNLSTTLATNAIVEGRTRSVCLFLIGYDRAAFQNWDHGRDLPAEEVLFFRGGHDRCGNEASPLDEEGILRSASLWKNRVEAFAISSLFSNRNPEHERKASRVIQEVSNLPCTCGHELTGRLNALTRASTAALNASLVPIARDWMDSVISTFRSLGLDVPLNVVRGDGSLVSSTWARERPIETILSGPAASGLGAFFLSGLKNGADAVVIDVGGTTTDLVMIRGGALELRGEGAKVGSVRAMVPSGDISTIALGGDSEVSFSRDGNVLIGPRRAEPLCFLEGMKKELLERFDRLNRNGSLAYEEVVFLFPATEDVGIPPADDLQRRIMDRSSETLLSLGDTSKEHRNPDEGLRVARELVRSGRLLIASFTPSDAICAMGDLDMGDREVALEAARIMARLGGSRNWKDFCETILSRISQDLSFFVLEYLLGRRGFKGNSPSESRFRKRLAAEMIKPKNEDGILSINASLKLPLLGVGAPCGVFLPDTALLLKADHTIPQGAPVANAVGAAIASSKVRKGVLVLPLPEGAGFRIFFPWGTSDSSSLGGALESAEKLMKEWLSPEPPECEERNITISLSREYNQITLNKDSSYLLGVTLWFEAVLSE